MEAKMMRRYDIMEVCLLAGKIMLQSGAETYRVEDTMMRIAASYGIKESHSYVTPTGIIFSIETEEPTKTKLIRINERSTDLEKVTLVNSLSRQISKGHLSVEEAFHALEKLDESDLLTRSNFSSWQPPSQAVVSLSCSLDPGMTLFRLPSRAVSDISA